MTSACSTLVIRASATSAKLNPSILIKILKPPNSWQTPSQLNALLPPVRLFSSRGSIDRYGFSHVLAARCSLRAPRRTFADWVHGWIWDDTPTADSLHFGKLPRNLPLVVRNEREAQALKNEGFTKVSIGGLPFAYIKKQHHVRNPHALLAMPPHSAEAERLSSHQIDYMDYLESIKNSFDGVYVSIFHLDWNGPMRVAAEQRGLHTIRGARPDDCNSLMRMRSIFDAFDCVTSNTMGSHFVYALFSGCRFSFSGPFFTYDEKTLLASGNPHGHSVKKIERLALIQQKEYLLNRFGEFFHDDPASGVSAQRFGCEEVGLDSLLSASDIIEILGWSLTGQVRGYAAGSARRFKRAIQSLI